MIFVWELFMRNVFILSLQMQTFLYFSLLRAVVTLLVILLFCKLGVYSVVRRFKPSPVRQKANGKNHPCSWGGSRIRSELTYFQPWVTAKCCMLLWCAWHHWEKQQLCRSSEELLNSHTRTIYVPFLSHKHMWMCPTHDLSYPVDSCKALSCCCHKLLPHKLV